MTESVPNLETPVDDSAGLEVPELIRLEPQTMKANPFDIALIIDGVVYSTYNVDGQSAAQFLAQPTFVRYTNEEVKVGYSYRDGQFFPPEYI